MKRIITSFLAMLLLAFTILPITVSAAEKDALKSPALSDVEMIGSSSSDTLVSYKNIDALPENEQVAAKEAYQNLSQNYDKLEAICDSIPQITDELYLDSDEVAVSDFFVIQGDGDDSSNNTITLTTDAIEDFVALLRYEDGEWIPVEDAVLADDGKSISFSANGTAPYAVVVEAYEEPETLKDYAKTAPEMTYTGGDGAVYLIVTPYKDKATLSRPKERALEQCYRMIEATSSVVELNAQLDDIAEEKGFDTKNSGVSQLFDISPTEEKGIRFVVQLTTDAKDFISLLHFKNSEWVVVDDVTVNYEDNSISFASADFSPFSIVSNYTEVPVGISNHCWCCGCDHCVCCWISLLLLIVVIVLTVIDIKQKRKLNQFKREQSDNESVKE